MRSLVAVALFLIVVVALASVTLAQHGEQFADDIFVTAGALDCPTLPKEPGPSVRPPLAPSDRKNPDTRNWS